MTSAVTEFVAARSSREDVRAFAPEFARRIAVEDRGAFSALSDLRDRIWAEMAAQAAESHPYAGTLHPRFGLMAMAQDGSLVHEPQVTDLALLDMLCEAGHHALADELYAVGRPSPGYPLPEAEKRRAAEGVRREARTNYVRIACAKLGGLSDDGCLPSAEAYRLAYECGERDAWPATGQMGGAPRLEATL